MPVRPWPTALESSKAWQVPRARPLSGWLRERATQRLRERTPLMERGCEDSTPRVRYFAKLYAALWACWPPVWKTRSLVLHMRCIAISTVTMTLIALIDNSLRIVLEADTTCKERTLHQASALVVRRSFRMYVRQCSSGMSVSSRRRWPPTAPTPPSAALVVAPSSSKVVKVIQSKSGSARHVPHVRVSRVSQSI